jgi:carbamoyltransferase
VTAILGISAYYHDAAAALIVDGEIVAAAQEERFSREKYDPGFPERAIASCLARAGLEIGQIDYVGYYDKPYMTFERLLETYLAYAPRGYRSFARAMPAWLKEKLRLPREMRRRLAALGGGYRGSFVFAEHHESHAAAAFFPSPFEESAILTFDGVGEWATASFGVGRGNRVELERELRFPHSLGLLYTAFTQYAGFRVNADEYKLMGLAPYGEPRFVDLILEELIDLRDDGSFRMNMDYFDYAAGLVMTSPRFHRLFGEPPREPESEITRHHMDVAASVQRVTEEIVLRTGRHVHEVTGESNLCLAGGVALNCVANGRLLREGPFERIWIQPAAGDAGSALGTAQLIWYQLLGNPRTPHASDGEAGALLGPEFSDAEIRALLEDAGVRFTQIDDDAALADRAAELLAEGRVVGWFQGRMEFGPRALGARSILADPRRAEMQSVINRKVKFREGFRPFAPAVLRERAAEYFDCEGWNDSPYMLVVAPVAEAQREEPSEEDARAEGLDRVRIRRSSIPAVTHVDYSARIQTVDVERHGLYRRLLEAFERRTGCPVLVNTSFNLSWEPIVCTPREAYRTFMSSDVDALCMGHFLIEKHEQPVWVSSDADDRLDAVLADLLASPCCEAGLLRSNGGLTCADCGQRFPVEDGIPRLYWPHDGSEAEADVTGAVKAFYEENPFPNYQDHESLRSLIEKSRRSGYGHWLDRAIPFNSTALEVGCGTGQLSNFLGIGCRRVVGTDLCLNSLRLGEEFRREHDLARVAFAQMNLFRPAFRDASFDVLLCNGVLHHTSDPRGGFEGLLRLVKPGGVVVIGLYNRWGRWMTDARRVVFRLTGGRLRRLDPYLRSARLSPDKERAWFADQYSHPHESKHSIGETLDWFDASGLEFLRGVPSVTLDGDPLPPDGLFTPERRGSRLDHFLSQALQIVTGNREGGFFVMIGRRPAIR